MLKTMQLQRQNIIKNVIASYYNDSIFVLSNSLEGGFIPQVGDIVIDENYRFLINNVEPLITGKSEFDNFALKVTKI